MLCLPPHVVFPISTIESRPLLLFSSGVPSHLHLAPSLIVRSSQPRAVSLQLLLHLSRTLHRTHRGKLSKKPLSDEAPAFCCFLRQPSHVSRWRHSSTFSVVCGLWHTTVTSPRYFEARVQVNTHQFKRLVSHWTFLTFQPALKNCHQLRGPHNRSTSTESIYSIVIAFRQTNLGHHHHAGKLSRPHLTTGLKTAIIGP